MRTQGVVVALFAMLSGSCTAQQDDVQKAITSALKWHFRWMEPFPPELTGIQCSVALFEEKSFAYCQPVALSMNIATRHKEPPRVTYLGRELSSFERSLATFSRNIRHGRSLGPVRKFSIAVQDLHDCVTDPKHTEQAPSVVLPKDMRTALLSRGHTLRYPIVCQGDPFYLLYCLTNERIFWIWLYEINGDQFDLRWSFDADTQQRKPPDHAVANLSKDELWYKAASPNK